MRFACVPVAILACACGRIGFGGAATGDAGGSDAPDDTGVVDVPPIDTRLFDAPPSVCGASVRMCDGFESSVLDARWMLDNSMGSVSIDTSVFYRGGSSLRSHVDAVGATPVASPRGSMRTYQGLPIVGTVYVRVFAFFPSTIPGRFAQWINAANDSGLGTSVGIQDRDVVNNDYAVVPSAFERSSTTKFPLDQWVCVTYQIASGVAGPLKIFLDGVEVADVAITPSMNHPAPTHVYLGLDFPETFSNQPAADAWFDEIVIDDSPVACSD